MNKIQLGLTLIFSGIIMNMLGRIVMPADSLQFGIFIFGIIGLWMIASLLVFLYGIYLFIVALIAKYHPPNLD